MDKKSDYYTHPESYTDANGHLKTFTEISHDKKTTISAAPLKDEDKGKAAEAVKDYKLAVIEKILALPAGACPLIFDDFRIRETEGFAWNEVMLKDQGVPVDKLRDLLTLTEKRYELSQGGAI